MAIGTKGQTLHFSNAFSNQEVLQNHDLIHFHRLVLKAKPEQDIWNKSI